MGSDECLKCGEPVQVFGCKWCKNCYYPGIDKTTNRRKLVNAIGLNFEFRYKRRERNSR